MMFADEYESDLAKLEELKELASDMDRCITIRVHLPNFQYIEYGVENNQNMVDFFNKESILIKNLLRKEKLNSLEK